jgi:nicotinate phosphoribosyltransferase
MIITSLLDTDLYKFTMMQVVLHHFPGAQVEYKFKCRNEGVDLRPYVELIRDEINQLCTLRFRERELEYLLLPNHGRQRHCRKRQTFHNCSSKCSWN